MRRTSSCRAAFFLGLVLSAAAAMADDRVKPLYFNRAASAKWDDGASKNWGIAPGGRGSYNQIAWVAGSDAVFEGTGASVAVDMISSVNSLTFNGQDYMLNGGRITLTGIGGGSITVGDGLTATIASQLDSSSEVNKLGGGTLIIGSLETNNNGNFAIAARGGTVCLNKASAVNINSASNITAIDSGATVQCTGTGNYQVSPGGAIHLTGGTLDINGQDACGDTNVTIKKYVDASAGRGISTIANTSANGGSMSYMYWQLNAPLNFNTAGDLYTYARFTGSQAMGKFGAGKLIFTYNCYDYTGDFTINEGTVQFGTGGNAGALGVNIKIANNGEIIYNRSDACTVYNVTSGSGSVIKIGSGVLTLAGVNTYSGTTIIAGGTLALGKIGSIANSRSIDVGASCAFDASAKSAYRLARGQTLAGRGTIIGNFIAADGSTLSPGGNGIGKLIVNGRLSLEGDVVMDVSKSGTSHAADAVVGATALSVGGVLHVTLNGDSLAAGDSWTLFKAKTIAGEFANYDLPALDRGLMWDTSELARTGILSVKAAP